MLDEEEEGTAAACIWEVLELSDWFDLCIFAGGDGGGGMGGVVDLSFKILLSKRAIALMSIDAGRLPLTV